MPHDALASAVDRFSDEVAVTLAELAGRPVDDLRREVVVEAAAIAAALIDADGRVSDDECWGYLGAFGVHIDGLAGATPAQVRGSGLFTGKRAWVQRPSTLFDLLVQADRRDGTRRSHVYYRLAMRLAHTVASLDLVPSPTELAALEDLRTCLLEAMDAAGVPRPGHPLTEDPPVGRTPTRPGGGETGRAPAASPGPAPELSRAPADPPRPLEELLADPR